jgi:hypothetical protein
MSQLLYRLAAAWTVLGLVGGLGYREITKAKNFDGYTQLAVVHTHALVLGLLVSLLLLVLDRVFDLSASRWFRPGVWVYNAGVLLTVVMQTVIGIRTVNGHADDSAALAGISGTGHMVLTVGLVLIFLALGRAVRTPVGSVPASVAVSE